MKYTAKEFLWPKREEYCKSFDLQYNGKMKIKLFGWLITIERVSDKVAPAVLAKKKRAREAVQRAIDELRAEGAKITAYAVAKRAGVSPHTAKKYMQEFLAKS